MTYKQPKPLSQPPAPTPGAASYKQPHSGPTPPGPDDCPLCHDYAVWPAEWKRHGWLPPRQQMCEVHVGEWDFIAVVQEWNREVEQAARTPADDSLEAAKGDRDEPAGGDAGMF